MFQVWIHPCKQRTESQALPKPLLGYPNSRNPDPPTRGTSASDQVRDGDTAEVLCVLRGKVYLENGTCTYTQNWKCFGGGEEIINVFQLSFCFDTRVVLLESGLEEMQEGKEAVDLSSDVFLVENFTVLYIFSYLLRKQN